MTTVIPIPGTGRSMCRKLHPDLRALVEGAVAQGWRIEMGGRHYKLHRPGGGRPLVLPVTPSDCRAVANSRADIRRALRQEMRA